MDRKPPGHPPAGDHSPARPSAMSMPVTRFKAPTRAPQPADVAAPPAAPSEVTAPAAALAIPDYAALGFAFVPSPGEAVPPPAPAATPPPRHAAPTVFATATAPMPTPAPAPVPPAPGPTPASTAAPPRRAAPVDERRTPALRSSTASVDARAAAMARATAMAAARAAAGAIPTPVAATPTPTPTPVAATPTPAPVVAAAPDAPSAPVDLFADLETVVSRAATEVEASPDPLAEVTTTELRAPDHADADDQDTELWPAGT